MSVISLSSYQPRNAKPLNVAALWSDDLELPFLEPQQQLSTLELPLKCQRVFHRLLMIILKRPWISINIASAIHLLPSSSE